MYRVEILDKNYTPITQITNLVELDNQRRVVKYGKELSYYAPAQFRVGTRDPLFKRFGNILIPFANHVRIFRDTKLVWQGVIVANPHRNRRYIEVRAVTYLYLLTKVLINMDAPGSNGEDNYRTFKTGTMAQAITDLINQAKTNAGSGPLAALQIGTIQNPNFPANYTNGTGANIGGQPWTFSNDFQLQFDFRDTLYVIGNMAAYAKADFEIVVVNGQLVFNFYSDLGEDKTGIVFSYGDAGAIDDYDSPLDGEGMANSLRGIGLDKDAKIVKDIQEDAASIATYGKLQGVAAYSDASNVNVLRSKLQEDLKRSSVPEAMITVELNAQAYPLSKYDVGDLITLEIKDYVIQLTVSRRVTAWDIDVHSTGKETVNLTTEVPDNGRKLPKADTVSLLGSLSNG